LVKQSLSSNHSCVCFAANCNPAAQRFPEYLSGAVQQDETEDMDDRG